MSRSKPSTPATPWISKLTPSKILLVWCVLSLLEGGISLFHLVNTSSDTENAWLLGLSKGRLLVMVGFLAVILCTGYLSFHLGRKTSLGEKIAGKLHQLVQQPLLYYGLVFVSLMAVFISSQVIHLARVVMDPYVAGYLGRLTGLLTWLLAASIQTIVLVPLMRYNTLRFPGDGSRRVFRLSGIIFLVMTGLGIVVAATGVGLVPDKVGWDAPGVPVLPLQVGFIGGLVILLSWLGPRAQGQESNPKSSLMADLVTSLILWGAAFTLWFQEPLIPDFFAPEIRPPNYEVYPHSDAALHDVTAQHLLIGEGFPGVARKPVYAIFLALLHAIAGQEYMDVILIQVGVLAFFPVLLYWIAKTLHSRSAGWIAAGLVILRERNAIALSGEIGVANAKLMMSDLPATLAIVILTLLMIAWLRNPAKRQQYPLVIGAGIGLSLLLRPQFMLLIPAVILLVTFVFLKRPSWGLANLVLFVLGLLATLLPWLWRSHQLTGKFTLNDPEQQAFLTQQYRLEPGTDILEKYPGESDAEFIGRINDQVKTFALQHPDIVVGFVASHFAHNAVEILQAFPVSFWAVQNPNSDLFPYWRERWTKLWDDCCSTHAYIRAVGYWDPYRKAIQPEQHPAMMLNLGLISVGLAVVWVRRDVVGWIPLVISLFYSLSTAVGRYSGWRLILPADWVFFLYFAIGLGQISIWFQWFIARKGLAGDGESSHVYTWQRVKALPAIKICPIRSVVVAMGIILLVGLMPILVDIAIPRRYRSVPDMDLLQQVTQYSQMEMQAFLEEEDSLVFEGRALYPRYLKAGTGEPGNGWPAFSPRDYNRLGLIVISGSERFNVVMPMGESPDYFPNASDVIVVGCRVGDIVEAAIIKIEAEPNGQLVRPSLNNLVCPLQNP